MGSTTYSPGPSSAFSSPNNAYPNESRNTINTYIYHSVIIIPNHAPAEQHSRNWLDSPALQLCLFTAHSIVNPFQSFIYSSPFKFIAITETWLTDLITDKEILPAGFAIFRKHRGGGVLLANHQSNCCRSITLTTTTHINHCKIVYPVPVVICSVYLPLNVSHAKCTDLCHCCTDLFSVAWRRSDSDQNIAVFDVLLYNSEKTVWNLFHPL